MRKSEYAPINIFEWFFNHAIRANSAKCHFLSNLDMKTETSVSSFEIENKHSQKLLGVTVDWNLNFHGHVSNLCEKLVQKEMSWRGSFHLCF